jgi:hypothetical protein
MIVAVVTFKLQNPWTVEEAAAVWLRRRSTSRFCLRSARSNGTPGRFVYSIPKMCILELPDCLR